MKHVDFEHVCSVCYQPVSRHPDKADRRMPNEYGGFDHVRCHAITPTDVLVAEIFGDGEATARTRYTSDQVGKIAGHDITYLAGARWSCSCGLSGQAEAYDKAKAKVQARAHLRDAYVNEEQKP